MTVVVDDEGGQVIVIVIVIVIVYTTQQAKRQVKRLQRMLLIINKSALMRVDMPQEEAVRDFLVDALMDSMRSPRWPQCCSCRCRSVKTIRCCTSRRGRTTCTCWIRH